MPVFDKEKTWSYLNIYSLKDLKDIYLIVINTNDKSIKNITELVRKKIKHKQEEWSERKVLEYYTALKKFDLVNQDGSKISDYFSNSNINEELRDEDKSVFKEIYFSYFRFREISSWFIKIEGNGEPNNIAVSKTELVNNSHHLYYCINRNRFNDTFFTNLNKIETIFTIEDSNSHLMRFFDVFIKWGSELKILDRFSLSRMDIKIEGNKELSIAYFIKPFIKFDLIKYILSKDCFTSRHIAIQELIYQIVLDFRFSVAEIKNYIEQEIILNDKLTFERTSQIFIIKGKESEKKILNATYLYPIIEDNYISHLIIRK